MFPTSKFSQSMEISTQLANHANTGSAQRNIVGILHSVAKALTVLQFLRQGAGIAMQMRQAQADDWDDRGAPFWYYVSYCFQFSIQMHPGDKLTQRVVGGGQAGDPAAVQNQGSGR